MTLPSDLVLLINPEKYDDRAFVHPNTKSWEHRQQLGWKPITELSAEARKEIGKYFKAPDNSAGALADYLWDLSQPRKREGKPPKFVPYSGKPPVQKED